MEGGDYIKHVQTLLRKDEYTKVRVLALDLDITLRELLKKLILTGYETLIAQRQKENTNG